MSNRYDAVIWVDRHEARIFHFDQDEVDRAVLHPHCPTRHIHPGAHCGEAQAGEDRDFLHDITAAVADAGAILITGPADANMELVKYIQDHDPQLIARISGVEIVDDPSAPTLVALTRRFFKTAEGVRA